MSYWINFKKSVDSVVQRNATMNPTKNKDLLADSLSDRILIFLSSTKSAI